MNVSFNRLFFEYICKPLLIVFEVARMIDALATFIVSKSHNPKSSLEWLHPT